MAEPKTKKEIKDLQKKIARTQTPAWDQMTATEQKIAYNHADQYKQFLDQAKTERQAVHWLVADLEKNGFSEMGSAGRSKKKVYRVFRNKVVGAAIIGQVPVSQGVNLLASHIDSPRLDLKQNPLYQEVDLALLKAHYYGGIRKYQWLARPLALYGKVILKNGRELDLVLGEEPTDPVFTIADLLPHLARKLQSNKKLADVFDGEKMNLLAGSLPTGQRDLKDRFKLTVLKFLYDNYQMVEEDFISAEFEAVPAGCARDVGVDRSMIGAYGQDDRICAYASWQALRTLKKPGRTAVSLFFDKEEVGSEGNSGAKSAFLEDFMADLLEQSQEAVKARTLRQALANTISLSADVNGALDPDFQEVHEKRNAARLGYGVCITKFTGSGGKSGANDASAEFVGFVRRCFHDAKVTWQTGELGKVDEGGGGTIAKFLAEHGLEIVDCGPALLGMHSPFEISSKADVYMTYKAYQAFLAVQR